MSAVISETIVEILRDGSVPLSQALELPLDPTLRRKIEKIFEYTCSLTPNRSEVDLAGASEWAKAQIGEQFPFLLPQALNALAKSCTVGWK